MKTYTTKLIPSDFLGNKYCPMDCIGYRALKRAHKPLLGWFGKLFTIYCWGSYTGEVNNTKYYSYLNHKNVNMVKDVKVGDEITFINDKL